MSFEPRFDRYIGIDYSGAETAESSSEGIHVFMAEDSHAPTHVLVPPIPRQHWTRRGFLAVALTALAVVGIQGCKGDREETAKVEPSCSPSTAQPQIVRPTVPPPKFRVYKFKTDEGVSVVVPVGTTDASILFAMQRLRVWLVAMVIVCLPLLYIAHLIGNYIGIRKDLERKSAIVVHPRVGDNEASDFGYIYSMRRENHIREGSLNLVWFVVLPATNVHYSCPYEEGYSDFKTGDSVRLIHTTSDDEGDYGYIVGLYDKESNKAASVWSFNLDSAEFDDPRDDE